MGTTTTTAKRFIWPLAWLRTTFTAPPASARVTRFEIIERAPFAEGKSLGEAGSYERNNRDIAGLEFHRF